MQCLTISSNTGIAIDQGDVPAMPHMISLCTFSAATALVFQPYSSSQVHTPRWTQVVVRLMVGSMAA